MKYRITTFTCLLLSVSLFLFSCNTTNSDKNPPEMPPPESMKVDMSEMESASNKTVAKAAESNFNTALFAAGVAKVILEANLAIPRALMTAAQDKSAEAVNGNEWEWSYTTAANGENYGVRLTASVESTDEVTWNFYVTNSELGYDNQLFFTGTSDFEATSGTWTYFDLESGNEVSVVTWNRADNEASVTLEVESDRNDNLGDSISYDFDGTIKTVVFVDVSEDETTTISYNTETMTGFIISPNYNEGAKSCWDENLNNTTCSS
ncbi:hypothetical protein [Gracilimonas sp.]|uniref:hypothetical protein n=1 Tax=Gracilimonas sp. TaxID=1974203 RepID=UPI003BA93668